MLLIPDKMDKCVLCMKRFLKSQQKITCCICNNNCHIKCANVAHENVNPDWFCQICIKSILPFGTLCDDELEILLSGLTDRLFGIYNNCKNMTFESVARSQSNKFNFDEDINSDTNFYSCINASCNYYTDEEFNDKMRDSLPNYGLTMIHLNCRSLVKHFGEIRNFLRNIILKFDIVALSETWLIPDQHDLNDYKLKYEGYTMYSTSRTTKNGGGVALYINDAFACDRIPNISVAIDDCMESIFVKVKIQNNLKVNVGCLYRAPNTNILRFNDELQNILETVKQSKVYICGDYNIDLLKYECHQNSKDFVNQLFSYGFYPLIKSPTRVTGTTSTLIDNIYTNEIGIKMENGIMVNDISSSAYFFFVGIQKCQT